MRKILIIAALSVMIGMGVSACSTIDAVLTPNPNVVATMESSLAAADSAALIYVQLPACGVNGQSNPCSDAKIVKNIGSAAQAAYTAVKAAEANETADTVTSANNAIAAYQAIVNALN